MGTYNAEVLTDSPIRYWKLDDSTGTDTQGNGNLTKGTSSAAPTTGVTGQSSIGTAWTFDGGDQATFTMPSLSTTMTFEMFFKSDGATKSSHTFLRFDGTDVGVIRMQGDGSVYPGQIYGVIGSAEFNTGTRYDDNNWHHLAVVVNGTSVKVYVDKVLKNDLTSGKSSYSFGGTGYVGRDVAGTSNEYLIGGLDEIAIYNTALSSTRVSAHYDARANKDVDAAGVTVATSSSVAVDPAVTAQQNIFSTTFSDSTLHGLVKYNGTGASAVLSYSLPGLKVSTSGTSNGDLLLSTPQIEIGGEVLFKFTGHSASTTNIRVGGTDEAIVPAGSTDRYVRLNKNSSTVVRYKTWAVGAPEPTSWTNVTVPTLSYFKPNIEYNFSSTGEFTLDYMAVNTTGVAAFPDAVVEAAVATASGLAVDPAVTTTVPVTVAADPATGSGLAVDPVVDNSTPAVIFADEATASGEAVDPAVTTVRAPVIDAEPFEGSGVMTDGGFAVPVSVAADVATGSGESVDVSLITEKNAVVLASPATGSGVEPQALLEINGVVVDPALANDPYYLEMLATTDTDDFWYRLDESAGDEIADARGNVNKDADLYGSYAFGYYGPESRKAIKFTDGYAKRRWAEESSTVQGQSPIDDSDTDTFAFEVVLKTTDGNGILAYGLDRANPMIETGPVPYFRNSIYLKDGKVTTNWNYAGRTDGAFELSGVTNVADGQWHHIVVAFNYGPENNLDSGLRIYIDGKLDIRRRRDVVPGLWASPDSYFGMPEAWRAESILYPWQKNFNGDVMEVAFRYKDWLVQDQVIELFYDVFGIVPVRVAPATAVGVMPDAVGKGNKMRALVLYTKWNRQGLNSRIGSEWDSPTGLSQPYPDEFDHDINLGRVYEPGESPWEELAEYRVVGVPIMREDYEVLAGPYRDPITDLPRLLNLQEDLDLDEFDVILFRNWPDEGADRQVFVNRGYSQDAINNFLASVKKAVVDGWSLEVTNPSLAYDLGLISGARPIPLMYDRDKDGETDLRAATVNPWDVDKIGKGYLDLHANNWHRVAGVIDGLTDSPTAEDDGATPYERIVEVVMTFNSGTDGDINNKWAYKLEPGDLHVGDEFLSVNTFYNRLITFLQEGGTSGTAQWDKYVWSVTPDGLRVGTPVYKFADKMWENNTQVDNPYKDFIGGAVVQPGDSWGGVRVAGKVFMNFAEAPFTADYTHVLTRQIVPPNEEIVNPFDKEDAAKREWDYSYARVAYSSDYFGGPSQVRKTDGPSGDLVEQKVKKDGSIYYASARDTIDKQLVGISIVEKYKTETVVVPNWFLRGMAWLGNKEAVPNGSVTIRPTPAAATATFVEPQTVAQRSVTVSATPAQARGVLVAPDEVLEPDVEIAPFPAEGAGVMTGYGKTITVAPFTANAEMVDNFDLISASGEQVVLYLHGLKEVELYLMEGIK